VRGRHSVPGWASANSRPLPRPRCFISIGVAPVAAIGQHGVGFQPFCIGVTEPAAEGQAQAGWVAAAGRNRSGVESPLGRAGAGAPASTRISQCSFDSASATAERSGPSKLPS
jgi:hypothetical protein